MLQKLVLQKRYLPNSARAVGVSGRLDWGSRRNWSGTVGSEASSITLWLSRLALARLGASITIDDVSIVALLADGSIPVSVTASCWSSSTGDDVWKTGVSITVVLGAWSNNTVGNGNGLETHKTDGWVGGEGFVNGAAPVGKVSIGQSINCWGRGDDVDFVVARELTTDLEGTEVGESINVGDLNGVVVLGKREVQASGLSGGGKLETVVDENSLSVVGLIST